MTIWVADPVLGDNVPVKSIEVEDEQVPVHALHSLPGTVETDIANTAARLATLIGHVDGLEGFLDGVETLVGATNTALTALQGLVDQLEGYTDGLESKLDTLHTDLNTYLPPAAPKMNQVGSIGTSSDVQFGSQALVKGMRVKNISTSGQVLYMSHAATPTSTNCMPLLPGEWSEEIECTNANQVYMRASASSGAAAYLGR